MDTKRIDEVFIMMHASFTGARLALGAALVLASTPAWAATCESLSSLKLPNATITMAQPVAAGAFTPPAGRGGRGGGASFADLPAFCRVAATLTPTKDSDIKIEVWLPATGWNGKFQAVGNGGWNGNIDTNALAAGVRRGYATASTDTGHEGGGGPWMQNAEKLVDYGHRAVHEMTVKAKAIASAFYDSAPKFSYFVGCSAGGRQGLKAAQRYPDDFDGIVAGAPALNATGRAAFAMWVAQQLRKEEASYIPASKYPAIHNAVLNACDAGDGVKDGVIENPRACTFDPKVLACTAGDSDSCLTPPQVEAARRIYEPLKHAPTGRVIFPGLSYGSELGWATFGGQQPFGIGAQMYQFMVFNDPKWDYRTLNFDSHVALVDKIENGTINALDPNLKPFVASVGKLLMYHGWADPQISAGSSVAYYDSVLQAMGGARAVMNNVRLFMVPGMNHCGGGPGTTTFDMLAALEAWVEKGTAPAQIQASRAVDGKVERTRPLCPYPQVATYKGTGSTDDAANFVCK
jgi:feruloyl esterase